MDPNKDVSCGLELLEMSIRAVVKMQDHIGKHMFIASSDLRTGINMRHSMGRNIFTYIDP